MLEKYRNFVKGVSANWIGRIGAALATSSFIIFMFLEILRITGAVTNAYLGLMTYLLFPTLFLTGLIMIPIGWSKYVKESGKRARDLLAEAFTPAEIEGGILGSKLFQTVFWMTLLNVVFFGAVSIRTLHFMDSAEFCGTACHKVMNPEWVTYQQSPHARVKCVECHVGEGVGALIDSKINGARQMVSLAFNLYEKPIPAPVHNLRPARETCEKCHWPEKFLGNHLKTMVHYCMGEDNKARYTTLNIKVGTGAEGFESGSHWHVSEKNTVRYLAADEKRMKIAAVEVLQADGSFRKYSNRLIHKSQQPHSEAREMDCIDCHNRATHIYEDPEDAVDERIRRGMISADIPFIKYEGLAAITKNYPDNESGTEYIRMRLENFYREYYPAYFMSNSETIEQAISTFQGIYNRNIHTGMDIDWGSYPNQIGHRNYPGCFRCHNENMVDEQGAAISSDCTLCHSILAVDNDEPFQYLMPSEGDSLDIMMQEYLREEFKKGY